VLLEAIIDMQQKEVSSGSPWDVTVIESIVVMGVL
jgi:hypothetical protein